KLHVPAGAAVVAGLSGGVDVQRRPAGRPLQRVRARAARVRPLRGGAPPVRRRSADSASEVGTRLMDELAQAAPIDASLAQPVALRLGNGNYELTLDPNYRGAGLLALESVRRSATGSLYSNVNAIPFALVDGVPVELTHDRLLDLRVVPLREGVGASLTARVTPQTGLSQLLEQSGRTYSFDGILIDAVYDLGGGTLAFVRYEIRTDDPAVPELVASRASAVSISGEQPAVSFVQYVEPAASGPVTYDDQAVTNEFSAP